MDIHCVLKLFRLDSNSGRKNYYQGFGFVKSCLPDIFNYFSRLYYQEKKRIQIHLIWKYYHPKIKHKTLRIDYKNGRLKNIVFFQICLQFSWVKRLYSDSFHEWKIISCDNPAKCSSMLVVRSSYFSHFFYPNYSLKQKSIENLCFKSYSDFKILKVETLNSVFKL